MLSDHHAFLIIGRNEEAVSEKLKELQKSFLPQLAGDNHPDLLVLTPENSLGIEKVRELEKFLTLKPYSSNYRVVSIKNAQKLTVAAQQALLKTLEEPPKSAKIILTCNNEENLLPTLVSRCQKIFLKRPVRIEISKEEQENLIEELENLLFGPEVHKFILARQIAQNAADWLEKEIILWRDLLLLTTDNSSNLTFETTSSLKIIAQKLSEEEIVKILRLLESSQKKLEANVNPRFTLEVLFLNFPSKTS
jgi:DNA polymerase III gamma/tau subunit